MSQSIQPSAYLQEMANLLVIYWRRWIVPAVIVTVLVFSYACLHNAAWEASQALLVRDEAVGSLSRPGRFADSDSMKTAQETVLELAKSRGVIGAALIQIGPRPSWNPPQQWPTVAEIQTVQQSLQVKPPQGAEFGRTEVFYLKLKDQDPLRAVALTKAVCDQLENRLQELRDRKAQSLVDELTKTVALARADLETATGRLSETEQQVGGDLAELRILNESASGESNLRQTLIAIKNELRQASTTQRISERLLELLSSAQQDPDHLIATPNGLLEAQPALRQMKDALVAAQLRTAGLLGEMSTIHPKVQAARASELQIRQHLHNELDTAIRGIRAEMRLSGDRVRSLQQQQEEINHRMSQLAELRAGYANLIAEVHNRGETLKKAQQDLADAQASQAAAHSASLITRLDSPAIGDHPAGPRRSMIVLLGALGGVVTGLGILFLTVPTVRPAGDAGSAAKVAPETPGDQPHHTPAAPSENDLTIGVLSLTQALARIVRITPSWN